jgi:ADP-ribosylglycohydrolase
MTPKELCRRALIAQAVADAMCFEFEFSEPKRADVTRYLKSSETINFTDDTQMALFGLYALGSARRDGSKTLSQSVIVNEHVLPAYLAWWRTQQMEDIGSVMEVTNWLEMTPAMCHTRAPGSTCLGSLEFISRNKPITRKSMGTGGVMRSLPFIFARDILGIPINQSLLAIESGHLTHKHQESMAAIELYMSVGMSIRGQDRMTALDSLSGLISISSGFKGCKTMADVEDKVGSTFTAWPAILAALLSLKNALLKDDFNVLVYECSINGGDSDTVAAIAGGLWGLIQEPPKELVDRLDKEEVNTINKLVDWTFQ